ncbi:MAG: leucine-rich repeat protein [Treponema sp.]|jgi:hypothetical protein|nr:leucine-rich repeat protein [Treponema sp.]
MTKKHVRLLTHIGLSCVSAMCVAFASSVLLASCTQPVDDSEDDPPPISQPNAPDESEDSKAPDTPTAPNTPAAPDTPVVPDTPEAGNTPTAPDTPTVPDTPPAPDTPVAPDTPAPDTPAAGNTPTAPDTPAVPDTPVAPDTPAAGENQSASEFRTVAELLIYLKTSEENSAANPYLVKLIGLDLSNEAMLKSLYEALSRFVNLDLSECVGESIPNITLAKVPNKVNIVSIKLPESVKTIASAAFSGLENLKSIDMPGLLAIEGKENSSSGLSGSFANCISLTSASLPKVKTLGKYAFYGCSALPSILLPQVEAIGASAFKNCSSLAPISLPQVTLIGSQAFYTIKEGPFTSITLGSEPPELDGKQVFYASITIYVPASALDAYKNTEKANWVDTLKAKVTAIQG